MADRYWFGGTGTWNTASTSVWSAADPLSFTALCSGTTLTTVGSPALVVGMIVVSNTNTSLGAIVSGSGNSWVVSIGGTYTLQTMKAATVGASVPTSADSVFFTSNSSGAASYTVTLTGALNCLNFNATPIGTVTFASGASPTFAVYGSFFWGPSKGSFAVVINFVSPNTGNTISSGISLNGGLNFSNGGSWTLASAITTTSTLQITNGTVDTSANNYAITCGSFFSSSSSVKVFNLNASTLSVTSNSATAFNTASGTNLTFNAGTSQINLSNANNSGISTNGLTFNNVTFTTNTLNSGAIAGANTFANLTVTGRTTLGIGTITFSADQTITGTLAVNAGSAAAYRIFFASNTIGTPRTITVGTSVSLTDVDFRDIASAGAAGTWTGTRLGDCKGNSGITFDAAKTVYYRQTGPANWGAGPVGSWSATSGGSADATQFPLAQDTAVFPAATYPASGSTTTINANYNIGTIDMSLRTTNTMTLATGTSTPTIYGNWINGTGITLTGTGAMTFAGRVSQTITSAGVTFAQPLNINTPGGSVTLQDNFINSDSGNALAFTQGTFNAASYNVTLPNAKLTITGTIARTLNFGSGIWTLGMTGIVYSYSGSNLTVSGSGVISLTASASKTFAGGGLSYSGITLNQGGTGALTIAGSNTFGNITNTVQPATVTFTSGTTNTFSNFSLSGTAGNLITINSSTAGTRATVSKSSGTVNVSYCSIKDSAGTGGASWQALTSNGNVDAGNNTGWNFAAAVNYSNFLAFFS